MTTTTNSSERALTPPPAAAIAGVIFSVLLVAGLALVRFAVEDTNPGALLAHPGRRSVFLLALNLFPFAGIAFLWFMGVLRSRLGALEDQFFATVFLGSGLLFVAMLFAATAVAGGWVEAVAADKNIHPAQSETFIFGGNLAGAFLNVFAIKMAGVFTFVTCTIALRTAILPRWVAFSGYACGLVLLAVITNWPWIALLFPLWMLLVSAQILITDFRRRDKTRSQ